MPTISRFSVRSNGRDLSAVRRPVRVVVETAPVEPPLEDMLKADLVSLAESRGVDTSGTKADIVARLGSVQ